VHNLAGLDVRANSDLRKADSRFDEYKQKVNDLGDLNKLDALIPQLQNITGQTIKQIEFQLREQPVLPAKPNTPKPAPAKIAQISRYSAFPIKRLSSRADVDSYLDSIRKRLYDTLESNDGILIN
jgi:hypothetical protein